MKKYTIILLNFKVKFNILFPAKYSLNDLQNNSTLIHETLLKYFRNYVISKNMQKEILYKKNYIVTLFQ